MQGLDVIVRLHAPADLDEVGRAVFALALQDHHPVTIMIVCQNFDPAALDAARIALAPIMAIAPEVALQLLNCPGAALLNQGLAACRARYIAVLDPDRLIYPEAYRLLIAELQDSGAAIAFGGILATTIDRDGLAPLTLTKVRPVQGSDPGQPFVLDRGRIAAADLVADDTMAERDLLRRLCAHYKSSIRLKSTVLAEQTLTAAPEGAGPPQVKA